MTNDDECSPASTLTRNYSNQNKVDYNLISVYNGSNDHVINRQATNFVSRHLTCLVCSSIESVIHIDLEDNRRISYDAARPYCNKHDWVKCYKNQDACFTIVQPSSFNSARIPISSSINCHIRTQQFGIRLESGS
uniref:Uncharacterized protein n=1 Tax=Romanomermis culicivorax TaxID=13658 RepID=A0A915K0T4_ROMCU